MIRELKHPFRRMTERVEQQVPPGSPKQRVLMVSSNGSGLGHLTRLSAIEYHLNADVLTYTMSSAYHRLGKPKSQIIYFPSYGDLGMNSRLWELELRLHFKSVVVGFRPDVIVFDGTYVYSGVRSVANRLGIPLIWIQRGCWKREVDTRSWQRHNAGKFATAVIAPGDYGVDEEVDLGELEPIYVPPIVLHDAAAPQLNRDEAIRALGLPAEKRLVLISVGAGVINDVNSFRRSAISAVNSLGPDWCPVVVQNPLNPADSDSLSIAAYPLSTHFAAFEFGLFAAGYNSVQETVFFGLPGIFVPNKNTQTDDQLRRARGLHLRGIGECAESKEMLEGLVIKFSNDVYRKNMVRRMADARCPNGAEAAADVITSFLQT